jgi:4-hydroxybenzoate polyprenyltransferase
VYFLFPANLVLYGINDLCDSDTDALNPKKGSVEHRLRSSELHIARNGVFVGLAITLAVTAAQRTTASALIILAFAAFAVFYSMPPFRLKARPALDSLSNILYALPGFLGYAHASGNPPALTAVIVAALWTSAMHLFSAVPDIDSDRRAGLRTSATVLGFRGSLVACAALWATFAAWVIHSGVLWPWSLAALIYPTVPSIMLFRNSDAVAEIYWRFPIINASVGMLAFFAVVLSK